MPLIFFVNYYKSGNKMLRIRFIFVTCSVTFWQFNSTLFFSKRKQRLLQKIGLIYK